MNFVGTGVNDSGGMLGKLRAAAYARFSDENQKDTSIDDQIRECRQLADQKGWELLDEFIRFDKAKSGRTLAGRDGLQELVELSAQKPRPFDVLIFHSSSRAARNLSDLLPLIDLLRFYEVQLYFVTTGLSSEDSNFRDLILMHGRNDEHFSVQLAHNVKRGQRGCVLAGRIACGRVFGFDNVPVEHPTQKKFGRPLVIGVDHVINPEEASVVLRIFETRASGIGLLEIARTLNREGVLSPLAKLGKQPRSWSATTILRILENQKYIGKNIWNQTRQVINPLTGRTNKAHRPRTEWVTIDKPEWRIISDELWANVQYLLKRTDINKRRGGLNRSSASRNYIFSGVLKCSRCKENFTVVSGGPARVRYGCYRHRFKGTCENATVISRPQLEKQLLDALAQNLGHSGLRGEIARRFREQLQQALDAYRTSRRKAADQHGDLNQARAALETKRENLIDAIEQYGMSGALQARLDKVESSLREIAMLLTAPAEKPQEIISEQEIEAFLEQKMREIASVLASDPGRAKLEVQNRVSALYFEPIDMPSGPGFRVTGDLRLFLTPEDVKVGNPFQATSDLYKFAVVPINAEIPGIIPGSSRTRPVRQPVIAEEAALTA